VREIQKVEMASSRSELELESEFELNEASTASYSLMDVRKYVLSGKYPAGAEKGTKSNIRKRSKSFITNDGELYYVGLGEIKKPPKLVIIDEQEQQSLINSVHTQAAAQQGRHLGRDKTASALGDKYYWPGMHKHVREYVSNT
jgi:hypothetical protein